MNGVFTEGKISKNIINQAIPLMMAQLVQLLYNVVDRIYIGHLQDTNSLALTGIGLSFPLIIIIHAFTNLFSTGALPLFSINRGQKNDDEAEIILGNTFSLLFISSLLIFIISSIFKKPILYMFGASDETYIYAEMYLSIYLFGTTFSMLATGLNGFINAQGFPKIGMFTVVIGALLNLVLDPILIFKYNLGIAGAAYATIISQFVSCVWVLFFLTHNSELKIKIDNLKIKLNLLKEIISLGFAGFIMQGTNFMVLIACNNTLKTYGGDLYIGLMTILNSIRDILLLPASSLISSSQPIISYNYGAKENERVKEAIRFGSIIGFSYLLIAWLIIYLKPDFFISIFTDDPAMFEIGKTAVRIYFFGIVFMSLQNSGQTVFTALKYSKHAIFFSLLRKAFIVVPLTLILPHFFGVNGVFIAEPVSNFIGGSACFFTMYFVVYKKLA